MKHGFPEGIKEEICDAQNGYCKICLKQIHSIHHKLHDTDYNRRRFPLFINSPMNGVGLCFECHKDKSHLFKITEGEARIYEAWLGIIIGGEENE